MAKRKAALTYRDGVGSERCVTCHAGVRGLDGAPVVSLRVDDVQALLVLVLDQRLEGGAAAVAGERWTELLRRLAHALGRPFKQTGGQRGGHADGRV
jgi:hypothetical protein